MKSMFRLRSCASSMISVSYRLSWWSRASSVSMMPSVISLISVSSADTSVNRTWYPTVSPSGLPSSSAIRSATAQLEADLGNLGRLARAGLPRDDHYLVFFDRLGDLISALADRQFGGIGDG